MADCAVMTAGRTARERARAELTQEIKDAARRQLAAEGAERLVTTGCLARARHGLVSAVPVLPQPRRPAHRAHHRRVQRPRRHRSKPQRRGETRPRKAWLAACRAVRAWAVAHPHEYALIYGSPVAGYKAPESTVQPASRVAIALLGIVARGTSGVPDPPEPKGLTGGAGRKVWPRWRPEYRGVCWPRP